MWQKTIGIKNNVKRRLRWAVSFGILLGAAKI
jgi:hypothetical protein